MAKVRSSGDREVDIAAWDKTIAEFKAGSMLGPFYSLSDLPVDAPRLLWRFPLMEKHGGAVVSSCRLIDDCRSGGQNDMAATSSAHRPADLDAWCALIRYNASRFHEPIEGFPSDYSGAYRQIPGDPAQAGEFPNGF